MKRTLAAALTAALFMTLFAGMASAGVQVGVDPVSDRPATESDQVHDFNIRRLLHKCWRVLHSDEASDITKRRCERILKRWCHSHPDSRVCYRPPPPPDCRPVDRVTDLRCCLIVDRVTDLRCHSIDPPPTDRPIDRPTDRPTGTPVFEAVDIRPGRDGIRDDSTDRLKDKALDDAYLRADSADL